MEAFINFLKKNCFDFNLDFDLSNISAIKIGGKAKIAVFPRTEKQFVKILTFCFKKKIKYKTAGKEQ